MNSSCIAVIPARGSSKRISDKNIREFCGKPMIAYSIEAAQQSGVFDRILVSTDSEPIKALAVDYGAEVPFMRPPELSGDHTATAPVVEHALQWCLETNLSVDWLCCIYATAPFVRPDDLRAGYELMQATQAKAAFSVTTFPFPVQRALLQRDDGTVTWLMPEHALTRSQDLPETYHDAGQFYWLDQTTFANDPCMIPEGSLPIQLPRYRVQDIDTLEDWQRAEWLFRALQHEKQDQ